MSTEEFAPRGRPVGRRIGAAHRATRRAAVAALALLAMVACGGCIWLAIPSLAYQGYKAEQPANQGAQSKSHDGSQQQQQSSGGYDYE